MTTALLISTYNSPELLRLCLTSVLAQSIMPNQVLIADDGSTPSTARVVEEFAAAANTSVKHIWHEDKGFRLAAIRNEAIRKTKVDYIMQIDGDIVLHPHFVRDHINFAKPGSFVTGSRTLLTHHVTEELLDLPHWKPMPKIEGGHRHTWLTPLLQNLRSDDGMYVRGCHMAFWRNDLVAVNGYNEDIEGLGREDSELS